jgi:predicted translin family RNA/ssDNA-binding protein
MREMQMEKIADILEHELESAVEVKNKESLKRYIKILVENLVEKKQYREENMGIRSSITNLSEKFDQNIKRIDQGFALVDKRFEQVERRFEQVDKRFEQVDKRFEQVDKRFEDFNHKFNMMFTFMTVGFTVLTTIMVLFKFLQ